MIIFFALKPIEEEGGKKQRTPSPVSVYPLNLKTRSKKF